MASSPAARPAAAATHPNQILFVLLLAGISFALSQTMVVPALPTIARELHASPASASWILTGYLLSASVATPIVGKLGDLFGKGRMLTGVLLVFSVGTTVCALSTSIGMLIAGRVVQGVAGGVFPLAFGIIRDTFPRERVAAGIGALSAIFGIGGGIGLPLAGVVVDNLDVSWLFWIGLIALPAALAAHRLVPPSPTARRARIDWPGAILLSAALVALLVGVTKAEEWGWGSTRTLGLMAAGIVLLIAWLRLEAVVEEPLIELGVLRSRVVAATNLSGFLVGFTMFSAFLIVPQFAQAPVRAHYGFAMTVTQAGLLLAPTAAAQLVAGPLAGRLGARTSFRATLAAGAALVSAAFVFQALAHSHPWHFIVSGILLGAGISFALASMGNLIVDAVPQADVGIATGINTIMRTVGGAFGSAGAAAILAADRIPGTPLPAEHGYTVAFMAAAGSGLLALGAALLIPTRRAAGGPGVGAPAAPEPARA